MAGVLVATGVLGRHLAKRTDIDLADLSADLGASVLAPVPAVDPFRPASLVSPEEASHLLAQARARLAKDEAARADAEAVAVPKVVVLSLGRRRRPALVAQGSGQSFAAAVSQAAGEIFERSTAEERGAGKLKLDILMWRSAEERYQKGGKAEIDRSLEGLYLPGLDLYLLPEELLSRRLVRTDGDLQSGRLREYLTEGGRSPQDVPDNPGRAGAPFNRLKFASFFEGEDGVAVPLLRGNRVEQDISPAGLLATARSGGDYLVRQLREDGSFGYSYEAKKDEWRDDYNLLRHAGSCYSLVELAVATGDDRYLEAARVGLAWLLEKVRPSPEGEDFHAIVSPGEEAKLGGSALGVLALSTYRAASGDARWEEVERRLASFLLFQQSPDGRFNSKYSYVGDDLGSWESIYYPGEAILALTRLSRLDSDPRWLDAARRGADWLIDVRDAGLRQRDLPHDHWLLMGLLELDELTGDGKYFAHGRRIADAILAAQRRGGEPLDWVGSYYNPPRSTPTATRSEALVAMFGLAVRHDLPSEPYEAALQRAARFQRSCQLSEENALYLPRPDLATGGFRRSLTNWEVRIDYVQHNVSALLGYRARVLAASG